MGGSRDGIGSHLLSSTSSDSRSRRRSLAVAVGWDHLEDGYGRKVVILPASQQSWSSLRSHSGGVSLANSHSFETGSFYRVPSFTTLHNDSWESCTNTWLNTSPLSQQYNVKPKQRLRMIERSSAKANSLDEHSTSRKQPTNHPTANRYPRHRPGKEATRKRPKPGRRIQSFSAAEMTQF